MTWEPWREFKDAPQGDISIAAPPCPDCMFWRPVALKKFTPSRIDHGKPNGPIVEVLDGVQLCHANDMEHDFSCFKSKEGR